MTGSNDPAQRALIVTQRILMPNIFSVLRKFAAGKSKSDKDCIFLQRCICTFYLNVPRLTASAFPCVSKSILLMPAGAKSPGQTGL